MAQQRIISTCPELFASYVDHVRLGLRYLTRDLWPAQRVVNSLTYVRELNGRCIITCIIRCTQRERSAKYPL